MGTDSTDCQGVQGVCETENDGVCDVDESRCDLGTDTEDCGTSCFENPGPDCCRYSRDGECDEPPPKGTNYCPVATDTADCSLQSCATENDSVCDVVENGGTATDGCPPGTDLADCGEGLTCEAAPGPDCCRYSNDGECDEPVRTHLPWSDMCSWPTIRHVAHWAYRQPPWPRARPVSAWRAGLLQARDGHFRLRTR